MLKEDPVHQNHFITRHVIVHGTLKGRDLYIRQKLEEYARRAKSLGETRDTSKRPRSSHCNANSVYDAINHQLAFHL
jgi:hypothetical protein